MSAARYDIYAEQGATFKLHMQYGYKGATGINLVNYTGALQVRRSSKDNGILLFLTQNEFCLKVIIMNYLPQFLCRNSVLI